MKKIELIAGTLGILTILAAVFYYQIFEVVKAVEDPVVIEEEGELRGYEEPVEAVSYLMANIKKGDLEPALRVCAIEDISEYADLVEYLSYTKDFQGAKMIPMVDSEVYYEITKIRLASDYGHMIQKCIKRLSQDKTLEIKDISIIEPENPDGKYFQRLEQISNILGARDVCECTVSMEVNGKPVELHLSLAKYKRFWKVILFAPMEQYKNEEPDIRAVDRGAETEEDTFMDLSSYLEDQLPLNYTLLNSRSGDSATEMLSDCWIYFQRGDILSALTYFDLGTGEQGPEFSLDFLDRQKKAAMQLQDFYYQMLLCRADLEWAKRHYEDTPEYIWNFLKIRNMQYVRVRSLEEVESEEGYITYLIKYSYDGKGFSRHLLLSNDNGWKLAAMKKPPKQKK